MVKFSSFKKALTECANETKNVMKPLGEKLSTIDKDSLKNTLTDCYNETKKGLKPIEEKFSSIDSDFLKSSYTEMAGTLSKICFGCVPIVGPILSEIMGFCMQKEERNRVFNYINTLEKRLSSLENRDKIPSLAGFQDLLIESCRQATETINEKRHEYIASILANGLSKDSDNLPKVLKILEVFKSLKDAELEILKQYEINSIDINGGSSSKFGTYDPALQEYNTAYTLSDDCSSNNTHLNHLRQLNLLQYNEQNIDDSHNTMNGYYTITHSGENLLHYIAS